MKKGGHTLPCNIYLLMATSRSLQVARVEEKAVHKMKKEEQNIFKMSPIGSVYYKEAICINFDPIKEATSFENSQQIFNSKSVTQTTQKDKSESVSITPRFNFDSKFYTSTFIVPAEPTQSDAQMKRNHKNKVSESQTQIDSTLIMVPKPKSRNQYCAVCRYQYDDYLNHINSFQHKKNIKKSKINNDIEYLTILIKQRMKNHEKDGVLTRSAKRRMDLHGNDYFQLEMRANKKRKQDAMLDAKPTQKHPQDKEDVCGEGQTPSNKKWHYDSTFKSVYSALD